MRSLIKRYTKARGAAFIEFSISVLLIGIVLSFTFDLAVRFYYKSLVTYAANETARAIAVDTQGAPSCADLIASVSSRAHPYEFNFDPSKVSYSAAVEKSSERCKLTIHALISGACILCSWWASDSTIQIEAASLIEDPCFTCDC
jgi:hypothetical protein